MRINLLDKIRKRNGYSIDEFVKIMGITKQSYYNFLKRNEPIKNKYIEKIKHLLTEEDKNELKNDIMNYASSSIINQNQTNCTNYNNINTSTNELQLPSLVCQTDEMEPIINQGDKIFYTNSDIQITTQKKIFLISNKNNNEFIRTIYINMDGVIVMKPENDKYKELTRYNLDGFEIKGRVVYVLKRV